MSKCWECRRGFCATCLGSSCVCSHTSTVVIDDDTPNSSQNTESVSDINELDIEQIVSEVKRQRRNKPDSAITDQQSTGRKRAAKLYPLRSTEACEWRNTFGGGGGNVKIYGCTAGLQQARHHGPDKNTLNNEPGNVHRICHVCHNTWHAKNDKDYNPNKPLKD